MFKVGDYIKCIDNDKRVLTLGKSYKAIRLSNNTTTAYLHNKPTMIPLNLVYVINDNGVEMSYFTNRFVLDVKMMRKMKLKRFHQGENDFFLPFLDDQREKKVY